LESLLEHLAEAAAFLFVFHPVVKGIDVDGQAALAPQIVPGVLVSGHGMGAIDAEPFGQVIDESKSVFGAVTIIAAVLRGQLRVVPSRMAVLAPITGQRPARPRFPRIPLPLADV